MQVIIAGHPGSGKTTVANIIFDALLVAGLNNVEIQDGENTGTLSSDVIEKRAEGLERSGNTFHIQTREIIGR